MDLCRLFIEQVSWASGATRGRKADIQLAKVLTVMGACVSPKELTPLPVLHKELKLLLRSLVLH